MKIMVVDDDKHTVDLISFRLTDLGYSIMTAFNGDEALDKLANYQPDLIILDISMPGMNGYEVCQQIKEKEDTEHIKIIFLTGKIDLHEKQAGFNVGAEAYITKPFHFDELSNTIESLLA